MGDTTIEVCYKKHAKFFTRFLNLLPARLASHDSTRVTIAFFAVCGLDILDSLDIIKESTIRDIINWIYRYQVVSKEGQVECSGFQGSSTINFSVADGDNYLNNYKWGHLAMTYTAISTLITLGDDLSRLDRDAIVRGVAAVQREDGSFSASVEGNEHDMRFVYCAAAICAMLDDWGTVNKKKMAEYILQSIRYDYGVSQHFEMESHGGTTFCAIAALELSGQLDILPPNVIEGMIRWLVFRQIDGFNGRPNKPVDTCYSFWIGASLKILKAFHLTDYTENRNYILSTQDNVIGGFSKWPGSTADPFHTYFGLCGLSFIGEPGILEIMPSLNISMRAYEKLQNVQKRWKKSRNPKFVAVEIE